MVRPRNSSAGRPKPLRAALVAGPGTLADLGPVVRHLVVGLLDEPMHVSLVCPAEGDVRHMPVPPVEVIRYGSLRLPLLGGRAVEALGDRLRAGGVSVLHALDTAAAALTRRLAERADMEYLVSVLSLRPGRHLFDRRCRAVLAGSEPVRRALLDARAAPANLIHLLPPPVHRARKATCFIDPRRAPAVVAAGPLDTLEHFAAVVEAFARLRAHERQCAYFLVGDGPSERRLRRLAEQRGLMSELTFVQPQDAEQLGGIVRAADIFVSPVPSQRVEIELLTAMAAGDPVVAAGARACDFIIPDRTALTYQPARPDELADRLEHLLHDRAGARNLAENALAHLRQHHSPARAAARLAELYAAVAARPAAPD